MRMNAIGLARTVARHLALVASGAALIAAAALDEVGRLLLSAHMVQHLLLTVVAPLLLVLSQPGVLLRRALPRHWRRIAAGTARAAGVTAAARSAARPLVAWVLFCGSFVLWHLPGPYEYLLRHDTLQVLVALSFFGAGLAFWSAVAAPARVRRLGHGLALLMVVTAAVISGLPGALMTFAPRLLYPVSADTAAICGLTPFEDQQLAGLLMWIPMDVAFFAVAAWLFMAWLREAERQAFYAGRQAAQVSAVLLLVLLLAGCNQEIGRDQAGNALAAGVEGDAQRGPLLVRQYGCGACHVVPGVSGAHGQVGPPLTHMGRRIYIAGVLRNSPANMMAWLQDPQRFVPGNAMPNMAMDRNDARDLTAYLYTLR
jgi:cytochrome c oxidase assembly factor CtaG/cytochrome c2